MSDDLCPRCGKPWGGEYACDHCGLVYVDPAWKPLPNYIEDPQGYEQAIKK